MFLLLKNETKNTGLNRLKIHDKRWIMKEDENNCKNVKGPSDFKGRRTIVKDLTDTILLVE